MWSVPHTLVCGTDIYEELLEIIYSFLLSKQEHSYMLSEEPEVISYD